MNREEADREATRRYRKTKKGMVTNLYQSLKARNKVTFALKYLHVFSQCKKFDRLFSEWVSSGYSKTKKPSIDRITNKRGYQKGNIQWLTWAENIHKSHMEKRRRSGVVVQISEGVAINTFKSQREAVLKTGIGQSGISMCLTGKKHTCGGFKWVYESELSKQSLNEVYALLS